MSRWISHRGYCEHFTENSMAAFEEAYQKGFRHLETDIRMTKDKKLVLFHDESLERLAGRKEKISELYWKEIQSIQLPCGQSIPKFEDFLESFRNCDWTLDIKEPRGEEILQSLKKYSNFFQKREVRFVIWKSKHRALIQSQFPNTKIYEDLWNCRFAGLAAWMGLLDRISLRKSGIYSLPYKWKGKRLLSRTTVDAFHRQGAKVLAFLPKDENETMTALRSGVDEILTNNVPLA